MRSGETRRNTKYFLPQSRTLASPSRWKAEVREMQKGFEVLTFDILKSQSEIANSDTVASKQVDHSSGFSAYLPSFLPALWQRPSPVLEIAIDERRHILYTRSQRSSIEVCDAFDNPHAWSCLSAHCGPRLATLKVEAYMHGPCTCLSFWGSSSHAWSEWQAD